MKTKKLGLLTTFLLLLPLCVVLLGAGCEKNEDYYENIPLEYTKCPCDSEMSFIKEVSKDNILLFDASKTSISEMQKLTRDGLKAEYICYFPEKDSALYCVFKNINIAYNNSIGYFCNFPQNAREWIIPDYGIYISFSADEFDTCNGYAAIGFDSFTQNVLTTLKRRTRCKK